MSVLDRIFGRKVQNVDRLGFLGDRMPDENELNRVVSLYRQGVHDDLTAAMEKSKPGKRLNILTTNTASATPDAAAVDPDPGPAKESLREKYRRLKRQADELKKGE